MVGVMLAGASPQQHHQPGALSRSHLPPALVGEGAGSVRRAVGESSHTVGGSGWSNALATGNGPGALPRDASTCGLWCAIALGALVRGFPLDHVGFGIPTVVHPPPIGCLLHFTYTRLMHRAGTCRGANTGSSFWRVGLPGGSFRCVRDTLGGILEEPRTTSTELLVPLPIETH